MYSTTKAQHEALAHATAQIFRPIFDDEYCRQFPSLTDFYQASLHFITVAFDPEKIALVDTIGFSTNRCPYQRLIDERTADPYDLKSKEHSELVGFAKRHKLDIEYPHALSKPELLQRLQALIAEPVRQRLDRNPHASLIGEPNLQRPLVSIRPKPHPLTVFRQLHSKFARALVGNHLERKVKIQPIALAYVDFEGTRHGACVDPVTSTWPHVHAVMFVRPEHSAAFELQTARWHHHFEYKKQHRSLDRYSVIERQRALTADEQRERLRLVKEMREPIYDIQLRDDLAAIYDFQCKPYSVDNPLGHLVKYVSKGVDQVKVDRVRKDGRVREAINVAADDFVAMFPRQLVATI